MRGMLGRFDSNKAKHDCGACCNARRVVAPLCLPASFRPAGAQGRLHVPRGVRAAVDAGFLGALEAIMRRLQSAAQPSQLGDSCGRLVFLRWPALLLAAAAGGSGSIRQFGRSGAHLRKRAQVEGLMLHASSMC